MIDRLLWLYPTRYRTAYGPEIAGTYRDMTAGASRGARVREGADLAAHALRVRFGLRSADPLGRFLATAAPFALASAAAVSAVRLTRWCEGVVRSPTPEWLWLRTLDGVQAFGLLSSLLVCLGAVVALTGRWAAGVAVAVCGLAGTAGLAMYAEWMYGDRVFLPLMSLVTVAVILACPPDLRPGERMSAAAGAVAAAAWLPVVVVDADLVDGVSTEYGAWPLLVLTGAGVVLALRARSSGLRELGAMAVASAPLAANAYTFAWHDARPVAAMFLMLPVAAGCVAAVRAARNARRPR
ncbi:hypothetical protein [Streptomyces uncialis]|uniref:Uncharacterized protein n=1 Tax=Streptomyces uncialis TaxID=1048205 RepID=A0A1Q4VE18_9ACTN|nr:hypothetical protein [Streptomyces uncialis]OKH96034.1 hypothetical protein AB852_04980 [Streptomyces uncialis]